jgi:hypothetical protein
MANTTLYRFPDTPILVNVDSTAGAPGPATVMAEFPSTAFSYRTVRAITSPGGADPRAAVGPDWTTVSSRAFTESVWIQGGLFTVTQ